jgi:two-component system, response regulator PdtaR
MEKEKFNTLLECMESSFKKIGSEMMGIDFQVAAGQEKISEETINVVIGMVGKNKGRIIFKAGEITANKIAGEIVGAESVDSDELCLCMSEFTNIFSGNAVTQINNQFKGMEMRLTPPAIFEGEEVEIVTPNIQATTIFFSSKYGPVSLDVGFEGV